MAAQSPIMNFMFNSRMWLVIGLGAALSGCTSYQMGGDHSGDGSSYAGATLNSPVTDQNPHVGGDQSYPSSVSDEGRQQVPAEKTGY
jgi:hypothetical protein